MLNRHDSKLFLDLHHQSISFFPLFDRMSFRYKSRHTSSWFSAVFGSNFFSGTVVIGFVDISFVMRRGDRVDRMFLGVNKPL